jgi:transcriptional regulator with XRE-family HTH domain
MESRGQIVGKRIAELRFQHAMDVPTLAARAGVSTSTIKKIEAGQVDLPHPKTIRKIAVVGFGVSPRVITRGDEESDEYLTLKVPRQQAMTLGLMTMDDMR